MLLVNRSRRRVVQVPVDWLASAIAFGVPLAFVPGRGLWTNWIFPAIFVFLALATFRVAKRAEKHIVVWGVFSRKTFLVKKTVLGVLTRPSAGGGSINVELMVGAEVTPDAEAMSLARYMPLGISRAMRDARRISEALDLPPPRLAPWLPPETPPEVRPRGWKRIATPKRIVLIGLALVAIAFGIHRWRQGASRCSPSALCAPTPSSSPPGR